MTIIWFIIVLGTIVLVHEFGHYLFAKLFKVYVYEFSIGMGPRICKFKKKKGETEYSIRCIPIGGYVSLAGEEINDDSKVPKNRKLYAKSGLERFLIMVAGVTFNFILAFVILFISALIYGSVALTPIVGEVNKDYPAYEAGIEAGDQILSVNGDKTSSWNEVQLLIQTSKGQEIKVKLKKANGNIKTVKLIPMKVEDNDGNVSYAAGITMNNVKQHGFINSLKYATNTTVSLVKLMLTTVKSLFTGGVAVKELSGPVGIYTVVGDQAKLGLENIMYLIAFLSVNVGVINLLPFPAFDGGRILFLIIEKIKGSPVSGKLENTIHSIGFFLLIALMIYVTFYDILRLF